MRTSRVCAIVADIVNECAQGNQNMHTDSVIETAGGGAKARFKQCTKDGIDRSVAHLLQTHTVRMQTVPPKYNAISLCL